MNVFNCRSRQFFLISRSASLASKIRFEFANREAEKIRVNIITRADDCHVGVDRAILKFVIHLSYTAKCALAGRIDENIAGANQLLSRHLF